MTHTIAQAAKPRSKAQHEEFVAFFQEPTRASLRDVIKANFGEMDAFDFKAEWPALPTVARHVLGIANSGGGAIVFGIRQNEDASLDPCGLPSTLDKADIGKGIGKFLPEELQWLVLDFPFPDSDYGKLKGKTFQVILVEDTPRFLPFVSRGETTGLRKNAIYVRESTETVEASFVALQALFNRRLETAHSTARELSLEQHLEELKILYRQVSKFFPVVARDDFLSMMPGIGLSPLTRNPSYPAESYEEFIARIIAKKKTLIERLLTPTDR